MPPTKDGSKRRPQFNVILPTILPREKPSAKRELAIKLHARREVKDMQDEYASTEHYYTAMSPGHEHLSLAGAFGTELHLQQQAEQRDSQDWMSHRYGTPPGHHDRMHHDSPDHPHYHMSTADPARITTRAARKAVDGVAIMVTARATW